MTEHPFVPPLTAAEARLIDQVCDRFEAACADGRRPRPEEYVGPAAGPVRTALLRQLLLLDWDYRRRAGDGPCAGDYLARFPGDAAAIAAVAGEMAPPQVSTAVR